MQWRVFLYGYACYLMGMLVIDWAWSPWLKGIVAGALIYVGSRLIASWMKHKQEEAA